ncbi:MAG: M15 family metallopeptidase [Flavobacteriaceae bacterium]|nr:M15 family metallopeptidase [Flavobacteriaceae bacterium]
MKISLLSVLMILMLLCSSEEKDIPDNFVNIKVAIPSIHLDIRYYGNHNFIGKPIDGYEAPKAYVTEETAMALKNVQKELADYNLGLLIYDAYRPQRAVNHFVRWAKKLEDTLMKQEFYPDVKKENLFKEDYIAARSGHSRGSTVDITLVDLKMGEPLDMGSNYDFFGRNSWPNYKGISKEQRAHRLLLQQIMKENGFKPYAKEWWHFTLKTEPYPETYFDFVIQ